MPDLEDDLISLFREEGVDEVVLRVSRYGKDGKGDTPGAFQALVKGRDRTEIWGVGILAHPVAALKRAIEVRRDRAGERYEGAERPPSRIDPVPEEEDDLDAFLGI